MMLKNVNYQKTLYVTSIVLHNYTAKLLLLFLTTKYFRKKIHKFNIFDDDWLIMNSKSKDGSWTHVLLPSLKLGH